MINLLNKALLLLLIFTQLAQMVNGQSLIVAEYRKDSTHGGNYTFLTAYRFVAGVLESKDTIGGFPTFRKNIPGSYVRFDLGKNFIYQNRYAISGTGNVIDLETGKLVIEEGDSFIKGMGDTLIFHRANIFTGTGYLSLDLKTSSYRFINDKPMDRYRVYAPGGQTALYVDQSKLPYKIFLADSTNLKKKLLISDAGNGPNLASDSQFPTILTFWLNDREFMYTVHRIIRPIKTIIYSQVCLRKYNIATHSDILFAQLDSVETGHLNDKILKDGIGQTIYRTSGMQYYLVDTTSRKLLSYPSWQLSHQFSTDNKFSGEYGRVIRYKGEEIARAWCLTGPVTNEAIAIEYGDVGSNPGYPNGFKVWFAKTQKWTTVDLPWLCAIIGWKE